MVDLRSDTVTRPTPEMRRAMAEAEVGDDVYGEDPTVNALEEAFALRRLGLAGTIGPGVMRLVTHHDVDDEGLERAVAALAGAPD